MAAVGREQSTRPDTSRPGNAVVELGGPHDHTTSEALVEDVWHNGDLVEVVVLLADGSGATAQIDAVEWDWLDARAGDILRVSPARPTALSA
jgi:hypothetical protein